MIKLVHGMAKDPMDYRFLAISLVNKEKLTPLALELGEQSTQQSSIGAAGVTVYLLSNCTLDCT